jgi:hypothetical protein
MAWVQVPFRGAAGGGAVASTQTNPFTMPHVYASALERKVQAVEDMRRGVKVRRQGPGHGCGDSAPQQTRGISSKMGALSVFTLSLPVCWRRSVALHPHWKPKPTPASHLASALTHLTTRRRWSWSMRLRVALRWLVGHGPTPPSALLAPLP